MVALSVMWMLGRFTVVRFVSIMVGQTEIRGTYTGLNKQNYVSIKFACFCVDSLRPSQQFFSYVGVGPPGLNRY